MFPDMDPILQNAISRRDAALAEADRWTQFVRMYEELTGRTIPGCSTASQSVTGADRHSGIGLQPPRPPVRRPVKVQETEAAAAAIIREAGGIVPTRRMLEELLRRGVEVGGKNPQATLNARLSRAPSLVYERPYGWKVLEEPRQMSEAPDPPLSEPESVGLVTTNYAVERGEVEHEKMTT